MMDSEELLQVIEPDEEEKNKEKPNRLGVVEELFPNRTAKVIIDGEDEASKKEYPYISTYKPAKGDRVLLASASGTYIIMGSIEKGAIPIPQPGAGQFTSINASGKITGNSISAKSGTITTLSVDSLSLRNGLNVTSMDVSGTLKASIIETSNLRLTSALKVSSIEVSNSIKTNSLTTSRLEHTGSSIMFFNGRSTSKKNVSTIYSSNAEMSTVVNKVNEIINAFKDYNLL